MYNESRVFVLARNSGTLLTVRVYDYDMFSNDLLGESKIDLDGVSGPELEIQTAKDGKPSGTVALKIERIEEARASSWLWVRDTYIKNTGNYYDRSVFKQSLNTLPIALKHVRNFANFSQSNLEGSLVLPPPGGHDRWLQL